MKSVVYRTNSQIECSCDATVIVCVSTSLTSDGAPYIVGTLTYKQVGCDSCGSKLYTYYIQYDENDLLVPTESLVATDITGIICGGCIESYVAWIAGHGGAIPSASAVFNPLSVIDAVDVLAGYDVTVTIPSGTRWLKLDNKLFGDVVVSFDNGITDHLYIVKGTDIVLDFRAMGVLCPATIMVKQGTVFGPASDSLYIMSYR